MSDNNNKDFTHLDMDELMNMPIKEEDMVTVVLDAYDFSEVNKTTDKILDDLPIAGRIMKNGQITRLDAEEHKFGESTYVTIQPKVVVLGSDITVSRRGSNRHLILSHEDNPSYNMLLDRIGQQPIVHDIPQTGYNRLMNEYANYLSEEFTGAGLVDVPARWIGESHCDYGGESFSFMNQHLLNPYAIGRKYPTQDIFGRHYLTPRQWLRRNTIFMLTQVCDCVFSHLHHARSSDMPEDWFVSKYPQIHEYLNPVAEYKPVNLAHKHHPSGKVFYPDFPTITFKNTGREMCYVK